MRKYLILFLLPLVCGASQASLQITGECQDGLPQGAYAARTADGVLRIEGSYANGLRQGEFTFYTAQGARLIVLPYSQGLIDGTVRAWHAADSGADSEPKPKLVSDVREGQIEGRHQTWYPDGSKRSSVEIVAGDVVKFEAWNEAGAILDIKDVYGFLEADVQGDLQYFENLQRVLVSNQPQC